MIIKNVDLNSISGLKKADRLAYNGWRMVAGSMTQVYREKNYNSVESKAERARIDNEIFEALNKISKTKTKRGE